MSDAVSAADEDNRERLRAFAFAVSHREEMHRLADRLKLAFTLREFGDIIAEMHRVGDRYESWLRADTIRLQARNDQRAARLRDTPATA